MTQERNGTLADESDTKFESSILMQWLIAAGSVEPAMALPSFIILWLLGILLIAVSWYVPKAGGFLWLGVISLAFGAVLGLLRRG